MKKVALYTGKYPDTTFLTLLARGLADDGIEVHIYGKLLKKDKSDRRLNFYTYSSDNQLYNIFFFFKYLFLNTCFNFNKLSAFYRTLKAKSLYVIYNRSLEFLPILYHQPDIIHIQWIKAFDKFKDLQEIIDAKFIISIRGMQLSISSFLYKHHRQNTILASRKADKIHSISEDLTNQLLELVPDVGEKIFKINPAINLDLFQAPEEFLSKSKNKKLKIITVCRLSWKKGLFYAIKALRILKNEGLRFEYNIIGDGEQREELEFLIHFYNLENEIKLVGKISQTKIKQYLLDSDVFLMSSVQEGFCNAVVEAQAMGLPCIVSNAEGLDENIRNAQTGFLFKKRNEKQLSELLKKFYILSDQEFLSMKRNCVLRAKAFYDIKDQVNSFKEVYESL